MAKQKIESSKDSQNVGETLTDIQKEAANTFLYLIAAIHARYEAQEQVLEALDQLRTIVSGSNGRFNHREFITELDPSIRYKTVDPRLPEILQSLYQVFGAEVYEQVLEQLENQQE